MLGTSIFTLPWAEYGSTAAQSAPTQALPPPAPSHSWELAQQETNPTRQLRFKNGLG